MKLEIDDKIIAEEMARLSYNYLYDSVSKDKFNTMFYREDIARSVDRNIDKLFKENKDHILNAIIDRCGEKYLKQVNLLAVLTALNDKK